MVNELAFFVIDIPKSKNCCTWLQREDKSSSQETRVSDKAAIHEEALWKSYLQTRGSRLMVTQTNQPEYKAEDN